MQFGAFSVVGMMAGYPLLQERALSLTGIITLYTLAAFAARTAIRWRSAKQLYQQLLLSYQVSQLIQRLTRRAGHGRSRGPWLALSRHSRASLTPCVRLAGGAPAAPTDSAT